MKKFTDIDYTKDIESFQGNTIFEDVYITGTLFYNLINQKEFYPPKLTTTERDTLSLTEGAMIYNSTNQRMEIYNGMGFGNTIQKIKTEPKSLQV